jgi:hypothetical protein
MTDSATSPNNVIDIMEIHNELRKARGELNDDNAKPRTASKEDIQRERAIRIRVARVEELMNENYNLNDIAFMTGEPKHVVARDIEAVRRKQREKLIIYQRKLRMNCVNT